MMLFNHIENVHWLISIQPSDYLWAKDFHKHTLEKKCFPIPTMC